MTSQVPQMSEYTIENGFGIRVSFTEMQIALAKTNGLVSLGMIHQDMVHSHAPSCSLLIMPLFFFFLFFSFFFLGRGGGNFSFPIAPVTAVVGVPAGISLGRFARLSSI